jgi:hypothetical protein
MHVWLGMLLLIALGLHVLRNWGSLVSFGRPRTLLFPFALSVAVAAPFVIVKLNSGNRGGNPASSSVSVVTPASLSDLAPLLKTTPEALLSTLKQQGYQARSIDETLNSIASTSGKTISEVLSALLPEQ